MITVYVSSRRRHTRFDCDWSSDVCSSDLDEQRELRKDHAKIGTTKRGIGPAYGDKAARTGLRISDLMQPILFSKKLQAKVRERSDERRVGISGRSRRAPNYLKNIR